MEQDLKLLCLIILFSTVVSMISFLQENWYTIPVGEAIKEIIAFFSSICSLERKVKESGIQKFEIYSSA